MVAPDGEGVCMQHNDMLPGNRSTTCNISRVEVWRVTGSHIRTTFAYTHHVWLTRTIVRIYAPRALAKLHGNVAATSIKNYCTWELHPEHGFSTSVVPAFPQHNKQITASYQIFATDFHFHHCPFHSQNVWAFLRTELIVAKPDMRWWKQECGWGG